MKMNETVKKETVFVLGFTVVLCAILQSLYLILGFFSVRVLIGTGISWLVAGLNFLLTALTVQRAIEESEDRAQKRIKASQSLRSVMILAVLVLSILLLGQELPVILALMIPLLFPRIAATVRMLKLNSMRGGGK